MGLFVFAQATTLYSLPVHNHSLIQGEYSNESFRQGKYVKTAICNTTDIVSVIGNISNTFTADNAYPYENLRRTTFSFLFDTDSTSYVLDTGANRIILNDLRQFKVSHPCNVNVKIIGGSNVSIRGTSTTYIPIKSNYVTVDYIKSQTQYLYHHLPQPSTTTAIHTSTLECHTRNRLLKT